MTMIDKKTRNRRFLTSAALALFEKEQAADAGTLRDYSNHRDTLALKDTLPLIRREQLRHEHADTHSLLRRRARLSQCRLGSTISRDAASNCALGQTDSEWGPDVDRDSSVIENTPDTLCATLYDIYYVTIAKVLSESLELRFLHESTDRGDMELKVLVLADVTIRNTQLNPTTTTSVTSAQLQAMIDEGVTAVLAARATTRNGDDSHTSGTGVRRNERAVREMETVFRISNCTVENQVKFATCTLMGIALTWWNSHARTVTNEVAYAMTWTDLKKKMTTKYCPRNEIKKIEAELWNLKVKGTDVVAYNQRFQELALLCDRMFPEETDKIERYVGGMPDLIYSSVVASKPKTMQEAIEMATELMDRRNNTFAERQAENKRKFEDTPQNNQTQQQNKRQNTGRAYAAGNGDKKPYEGTKPLCPKCNFNHYGPCIPTCNNCKKLGHLAKDCRSRPTTANNNNNNRNNNNNNNRNNNNNNNYNNNNPRAQGENTNAIVCFECGAPGHFKKDCP
ncbi:putative reverse transcriptase domain-containing protein [Tanacetum coccineum]